MKQTLVKRISSIGAAAALALAALCAAPTYAQDDASPGSLQAAIDDLSNDITNFLNTEGEKKLRMGDFRFPPEVAADRGGNVMEDALVKQLKDAGLDVTTEGRAELELRGEVFFENGQLIMVCDIRSGRRNLKTFEKVARDVGEIAEVLALTGKLSTSDIEERVDAVKEAFDNPKVDIKKEVDAVGKVRTSRISASSDSQFGLEICVKNEDGEYVPVPAENRDGIAFVDLAIGTIYGIRVFNDSDRMVAVTMAIDGLNLMRFTEKPEHQKFGKVIVLPGKPNGTLIKGWHKNNTECFEFKVGEFAESEAVKLRGGNANVVQEDDDDVGVITASFAFVAAEGEALPEDEKIVDRNVGTVKGDIIPAQYKETRVGKVGAVREVVSLRYSPQLPIE